MTTVKLQRWAGRRLAVTGGSGFLGGHVVEALRRAGATDVAVLSSSDYDLRDQRDVRRMLDELKPELLIHLAARVGGIGANQENAGRFFYDNAIMGIELLEQARRHGVDKYLQVGTVCSYPKFAPVPFREDSLWDGYPEETNAPYGVAKRALLVQAQAYRDQYGFNAVSLLPANLYGPRDHFDLQAGHVIPALIRKCLDAARRGDSEIVAWGSGNATREFLYVEDAAAAILLAAELYDDPAPLNVGTGREISIRELLQLIAELCDFRGAIRWDSSRPDGQPRRQLDTSRAREVLGFEASTSLEEGLRLTVDWYRRAIVSTGS